MTSPDIPRPEHPRPQLRRSTWLNLNGEWQFEIDRADTGIERGLLDRPLDGRIIVPFAPESAASGVGETDFLTAVWYRREVLVPESWDGLDLLLHFGAVDHDATVWVDGVEVARHRGGFTGFTADLGAREPGSRLTIVVRARDSRDLPQARGKQATHYANSACYYTRTTGIWQTVWLEAVPPSRIGRPRILPRVGANAFDITVPLHRVPAGWTVRLQVADDQGEVATTSLPVGLDLMPAASVTLPADRVRLWAPGDPFLYDLRILLEDADGVTVDQVDSYAGLRCVGIDRNRLLVNGVPVFQRLILDQGYWPDTLMTAPSDDDLVRDIELALSAGFNGARLHQKVFEERYLYHADRLGYLVWGEFPDWGAIDSRLAQSDHQQPTTSFVAQWLEVIERDLNHPAIVGWCPLNETYQPLHDRITQLDDTAHAMYRAAKLADPTRPVLDASGYAHRVPAADVYDAHDYEQDPARFAENHRNARHGRPYRNLLAGREQSVDYAGQPYFVSEFGGIWWSSSESLPQRADRSASWGYGQRVASVGEWHARFDGLVGTLLSDPSMFGYCFTQLTDTFQEQNGIVDEHRRPKFDLTRLAATQTQKAAYER